jgi:hypothetical protein
MKISEEAISRNSRLMSMSCAAILSKYSQAALCVCDKTSKRGNNGVFVVKFHGTEAAALIPSVSSVTERFKVTRA